MFLLVKVLNTFMEKIKFDYLLESLQIIEEMPKPATSFGPLNDEFMKFSPELTKLDPNVLGTGSSAKPNLFRKTVIGLYNDLTKEFEYTIPIINKQINVIIYSLFKNIYPKAGSFDIQTFEDIFPDSNAEPIYDSAFRLAESIIYSLYFPDFKSLSSAEFSKLELPSKIKKELMDIMGDISNPKSKASRLDGLLQQRFDMLNNPDDQDASLLGPLDIVKFLTGSNTADIAKVKEAYEMLFVTKRRSGEVDEKVVKRQEFLSSPEFKEKLTIDLFEHYHRSDRPRSSSAIMADRQFLQATNVKKTDYTVLRNEVEPLIKELKNLNKIQRHTLKKKKDPMAISPTLKKYEETGEISDQIDVNDDQYDINDYMATILAIWGVDIRKNINTEFNPSKPPFINSISAPTVQIPRKAVNAITLSSYNIIETLMNNLSKLYEEKGITITPNDFKTKIIDRIKALNTAPNEVEVLQSIYDGLDIGDFGTLGEDENQYEIGGIENRVVRAVFDKPENKDKFDQVKQVIKMQLQALESQLYNRFNRAMANIDTEMMKVGDQQQTTQQTQNQPVQESTDAVFQYMESQLQKDEKFKGDNSKYNNRGFKKPLNYWHWINK